MFNKEITMTATTTTMYHVNQETGDYGKCSATVRDCPVSGEQHHYDSAEEAAYQSEVILAKQYEDKQSLKKAKKAAPKTNEKYALPNAGSLNKVAQTLKILVDKEKMTIGEMTDELGIVNRQANYYLSATAYLGFTEDAYDSSNKNKMFTLSDRGQMFAKAKPEQQKQMIVESISHTPAMYMYIHEGDEKTKDYLMKRHGMSEDNASERLNVLKSWSKHADAEMVKSLGHPSTRADKWDVQMGFGTGEEKIKEKQGELCNSCFQIKPLTGICPNCDE